MIDLSVRHGGGKDRFWTVPMIQNGKRKYLMMA